MFRYAELEGEQYITPPTLPDSSCGVLHSWSGGATTLQMTINCVALQSSGGISLRSLLTLRGLE